MGGDCPELHQRARRDRCKAGRYEKGRCPFSFWLRNQGRGSGGGLNTIAAKAAPSQEAGPMTSCVSSWGAESNSLKARGPRCAAFCPGDHETAGGGSGVGGPSWPPFCAGVVAPVPASLPRASDHAASPAECPASQKFLDEPYKQQPPLNAANPLLCESPGASFEGLTGLPRFLPKQPSDQFGATLSFREWAASLPRWILKSRSPLQHGWAHLFHLPPAGGDLPHLPRLFHCRFPSWDFSLPVAHGFLRLLGAACALGESCISWCLP